MTGADSFILTYHSLDQSGSVISLPPRTFRDQMDLLCRGKFRVVPLNEVCDQPGSVALTFDDGYQNFREFGLPVLVEMGLPATVFVATGYIGRTASWAGQIPALSEYQVMSRVELREVAEYGVKLGAHAASHRDLTKLSDEDVIAEMEKSRNALTTESGEVPAWFAYPFGACDDRIRGLAASRFELACGTQLGFVAPDADPLDLPRLDIYYFRDLHKFQALVEGRATTRVAFRRTLRQFRSWLFR